MGLDMYLTAERHFWHGDKKPRVSGIPKGFELGSLRVEAAYWRKSNQIHAWFVKNVQRGVDDCREYDVAFSQLEELRDTCAAVLADRSLAPVLLPVQKGFFFGGDTYEDWYFSDLQETVDVIDKILKAFDRKKWRFIYYASW
jgi:hypothetical protein